MTQTGDPNSILFGYTSRLARNVDRMIEIRQKMPTQFKLDHEWRELNSDNGHLNSQIAHYNRITGAHLRPNLNAKSLTQYELENIKKALNNGSHSS